MARDLMEVREEVANRLAPAIEAEVLRLVDKLGDKQTYDVITDAVEFVLLHSEDLEVK